MPLYKPNLMLFANRPANIDDRQKGKNECLNESHKNVQENKNAGRQQWNRSEQITQSVELSDKQKQGQRQSQERNVKQLADKHVDPETNRKDSSLARWLNISTTTMMGDIAGTGPRKCLPYFIGP